jgi:hypothetical protein
MTYSCTARIDIDTEASTPYLVIYGYITTDTMQHSIKITRSNGFFATTKPEGIRNAEVSISDDDKTYILSESDDEPGLYLTTPDVYGIEGKTYSLSVSVEGQVYGATSYLPASIILDTVVLRPSTAFSKAIELAFSAKIGTSANYYKYNVYNENKSLMDTLYKFYTISDEYINRDKEVEGLTCYFFFDDEKDDLLTGNKITLRMDVITKEFYDHIYKAQSEVGASIPLFSGPPANVGTNIQRMTPSDMTPVAGFFTAYSSRRKSTFVEAGLVKP